VYNKEGEENTLIAMGIRTNRAFWRASRRVMKRARVAVGLSLVVVVLLILLVKYAYGGNGEQDDSEGGADEDKDKDKDNDKDKDRDNDKVPLDDSEGGADKDKDNDKVPLGDWWIARILATPTVHVGAMVGVVVLLAALFVVIMRSRQAPPPTDSEDAPAPAAPAPAAPDAAAAAPAPADETPWGGAAGAALSALGDAMENQSFIEADIRKARAKDPNSDVSNHEAALATSKDEVARLEAIYHTFIPQRHLQTGRGAFRPHPLDTIPEYPSPFGGRVRS
jgi:hypothetical protein